MKQPITKNNKPVGKIEVTYFKPSEIEPNDYNPNSVPKYEFELLKQSLKDDGFTIPIVCQELTEELIGADDKYFQMKENGIKGVIVDGEHRWKASKELDIEEIPVVLVNFTEIQRMIATIRYNKARGSENIDLLAGVFHKIKELGGYEWALDSLKLNKGEWDKIISSYQNSNFAASLLGQKEDFNQSWEPSINYLQSDGDYSTQLTNNDNQKSEDEKNENINIDGGNYRRESSDSVYVTSLSDDAYLDQKETEGKLNNITSPLERQEIRQQQIGKTYKINLIFSGEEGEIIQYVLGDNPANKILQICRNEYERMVSEKE